MSIATLNTLNLKAHIEDVIQDEDLMNSIVICFQETHLTNVPRNNPLCKFNLNIAHFVHGVLTFICKTIQTKIKKVYCNNKVKVIVTNMYEDDNPFAY